METTPSALAVKYFLDNFPLDVMIDKAKPSNGVEKLAHFYFGGLMEVISVFDRLIRYEKYFQDFIPPKESGISESEAIEYHLRSYIEDFYILQERIRKLTSQLINDLPNYGMKNQSDIVAALTHLSTQVHKNFKAITDELRREHVHTRSVSELDLVTGKFLNSLITGELQVPAEWKPPADKIQSRHDEVLATMKKKYTDQATNNSKNLREMKEWFASRFIFIFSNLNGHNIEDLNLEQF